MLYKPNTGAMIRVHGPFVSDEEVERVADHWRGQGKPDYVDAVTEEPEDGGFNFEDEFTASAIIRKNGNIARPVRLLSRTRKRLVQLASAPDGGRLQHRCQMDRAHGRRRAGRAGQPCGASRDLPRSGRKSALAKPCKSPTGQIWAGLASWMATAKIVRSNEHLRKKTPTDDWSPDDEKAGSRRMPLPDGRSVVWTILRAIAEMRLWWNEGVIADLDHVATIERVRGESLLTSRYIFMICDERGYRDPRPPAFFAGSRHRGHAPVAA